MRKLGIYEFGGRNVLYLMFKTFSSYCPYQKKLAETICYSEIVKPNILSRKLKLRKKKRKKKEVCVKHQHRNDRWWRDMWSPQTMFDVLWKKNFRMSWEEFIKLLLKKFTLELLCCLKITESFE